ncbi:MAG TPA: hybrid sensor histidine kinase/response regulator, partial [Cyanobacteria bacterium UBA8543]|nr:hybrid sensor histidine kinase/response regulator [Cyanobacteria bacterium UBA8543]
VFDARAMVGRYEGEFLSYEDAQRLIAIKHQVLETGVGTREEIFITLGEEVRYYDLTVEPLRNRDGEIVGITCATMDISDRK